MPVKSNIEPSNLNHIKNSYFREHKSFFQKKKTRSRLNLAVVVHNVELTYIFEAFV